MTEAIAELTGIAQSVLFASILVFLRIGAAMALLPAFGEMMVPVRVRLALTLALAVVVGPAVTDSIPIDPDFGAGAKLAALEIATGLTLGFALRLFVFALQVAGTIAAQSTSLSQLLGGQVIDPQPALGAILVLGGLALATLLGLHTKIASMFIMSYATVPVGMTIPAGSLLHWAVAGVSHMFALAVVLAMPFLLASLLYNLALGVINRAMPQLMVAFVGAPAITFGALVLLALTAPILLSVWSDQLDRQISDPFGAVHGR